MNLNSDKKIPEKTITQPPTQQQSMLKPIITTQPSPKSANERPPINSSAFPSTKQIKQQSISHKIIAHSYAITNNITMRTGIKQSDIIEVRHLQLEWFPLQYGDLFYEKLLGGKYRCLITETEVVIQWSILKQILQQKYDVQEKMFKIANEKKNSRNNILISPSTYFEAQGIRYEHLFQQEQQNIEKAFAHLKTVPPKNIQETNPKPYVNLLKIKIIISVMVFDVTMSSGYLGGVWWSQTLFSTNNSIYINTIGVSHQFRKTGLAKKMLQWLRGKMEKEGIFKLLYLHVIEYNQAAIRLYKGLGFRQLNIIPDYYHIDGKEYKGILLGLFLNGGEKRIGWKQWLGGFWR